MRDILVEAKEMTRRFRQGDVEVFGLRPASFVIRAGDRIALMGPSGSGKSTVLHLIADLDRPTDGSLVWPALGARGSLRPERIGMVFQAPSLIPTLSAVENVEMPLRLAGKGRSAHEAAMHALGGVGLSSIADKLPDELSGGQAQRVALARAIASKPRLVVADEPTGQLDNSTARQAIDTLLASMRGTQTALVVATHDPLIAERMDVTWLMEHGQLHAPERRTSND